VRDELRIEIGTRAHHHVISETHGGRALRIFVAQRDDPISAERVRIFFERGDAIGAIGVDANVVAARRDLERFSAGDARAKERVGDRRVDFGHRHGDAKRVVESLERLGVRQNDALLGARGKWKYPYFKDVSLHPFEERRIAAPVHDRLVRFAAALALDDAAFDEAAVDVHRETRDRCAGRQWKRIHAFELLTSVIEKCLIDRRSRDAVFDVHIDGEIAHRERPLAAPLRIARDETSVTNAGFCFRHLAREARHVREARRRSSRWTRAFAHRALFARVKNFGAP